MSDDLADVYFTRDKLIVEARQLIADAGGDALDEQAAARFAEIETELDNLRTQHDQRPAYVDPIKGAPAHVFGTRQPDPYAQFGVLDGVPSLTPTREDMITLYDAVTNSAPARVHTPVANFATVTTGDIGAEATGLPLDRPDNIRRLAEFAALQAENVGVGGTAVYPVFGDGEADTADEGTTKAEYDNITAGEASPMVIAVWTDMTMQASSVLGFESRLRRKLSALIARREDRLLVSSVLGTSGIQTHEAASGEAKATSLLAGATMAVDSSVGADPDVVVMNPADVVDVFDGSFGTSGETPENALRLTVHGMRIYPSSAITAGTALVGSWRAASKLVVGLRPTFKVDPYTQMKNNAVTVLAEEAVNIAVDEPTGFVEVSFDTGDTGA